MIPLHVVAGFLESVRLTLDSGVFAKIGMVGLLCVYSLSEREMATDTETDTGVNPLKAKCDAKQRPSRPAVVHQGPCW